jgi:hypothetical protein
MWWKEISGSSAGLRLRIRIDEESKDWCRRGESNPRPRDYETLALPLSYAGIDAIVYATDSPANVSRHCSRLRATSLACRTRGNNSANRHRVTRTRWEQRVWPPSPEVSRQLLTRPCYATSTKFFGTTVLLTRTGPKPILHGIGHCPTCPVSESLSKRWDGRMCIDSLQTHRPSCLTLVS